MRNVHLTPQLVQAVRDAVDILDLAGEHTRLKKAGRRHVGLCPLHKEKTPSFSVEPTQGLFYCFGCGTGGDAIKLHMLTTGDDFPAAIESLARRYGIPLPAPDRRGKAPTEERDLTPVLEAAAAFFRDQLERAREPQAYLARRRIGSPLIERYALGYAPQGWRNLLEALRQRFPVKDLEAAGLIARSEQRGGEPYDRFRHRLMFPISSPAGRLVGFGGRTLGDDQAKYINTAETDQFHKGRLLYGLDLAKRGLREGGRALLVEGYFDVLGAAAAGIDWVVAGMGTALTRDQARLLARYADQVIVGFDGDEAGENAFRRALPILLAEGLAVRRARFGQGHDPDSLRLEAGEAAVVEAVEAAQDAVLLELEGLIPPDVLTRPWTREPAAKAASELLRAIPDAIVRQGYARLAAERLGVPEDLLLRQLRGGGGTAPRGGGTEAAAETRSHGLEAAVLARLMDEPAPELPPAGDLPPAEVFFDPVCRNIYRSFYALYSEGGTAPPARTVLSRLGEDQRAIDLMARVLLDRTALSRKLGLAQAFSMLQRRWQKQRRRELARQIGEAQRAGDLRRAEQLYDEQKQLSHTFHRSAREGPGEKLDPGRH